jgi:hypothetical protein
LYLYFTGRVLQLLRHPTCLPPLHLRKLLQLYAPVYSAPMGSRNDNAAINPGFDSGLPTMFGGGVWLNLNGNYTLTFRAKATTGAPTSSDTR